MLKPGEKGECHGIFLPISLLLFKAVATKKTREIIDTNNNQLIT